MVLNERLDKNTFVLITTSVLDNGVNLTGINNIVVSDMERVKCLQMLGRARVSDADDRKTLYVQRFDCPYVQKRIPFPSAYPSRSFFTALHFSMSSMKTNHFSRF